MQVGTNSNDLPWAFGKEAILDDQILDLYRKYARIHLRLFPYIWTYSQKLREDGRAIQRPLGLAFPELKTHPSDVYLLGDSILVAPVTEAGQTNRSFVAPDGLWFDFFTGETHVGGTTITVNAPLEKIPVLVREGALIPMLRPSIDSILQADPEYGIESFDEDAGDLWVFMNPGEQSTFRLYDGTLLKQETSPTFISFERVKGETFKKGLILEVGGLTSIPQSVSVDGVSVETRVEGDGMVGITWDWRTERGGVARIRIGAENTAIVIER